MLATKRRFPVSDPGGQGLAPKRIVRACEASLRRLSVEVDRPLQRFLAEQCGIGDVPSLARTRTRREPQLGGPPRGLAPVPAPSFISTAATWCSAVRCETTSRSAISAFVRPSATSTSTSSWRAVSPAGLARVALRGPLGTRMPSSRIRPAVRFSSGRAPSRRAISSASTSATLSSSSDSISARSYTHPSSPKASAAAAHSRRRMAAYGPDAGGSVRLSIPARAAHPASLSA